MLEQMTLLNRPGPTDDRLYPGGHLALLALHRQMIQWMQHERLIHLLVTGLVSLLVLFSLALALFLAGNWLVLLLFAVSAMLLVAYLLHYFYLENTIQRWYRYGYELMRQSDHPSRPDDANPGPSADAPEQL